VAFLFSAYFKAIEYVKSHNSLIFTLFLSIGTPIEGWDGMMNGVPAPPDVYVWTIDAQFINQTVWPGMRYKSSDKPKTVGTIHLIK